MKRRKARGPFKRALITGITGSGGSYLAEYIAEHHPGVAIHGMSRWRSTASTQNLDAVRSRVVAHECDLMDFTSVYSVLKEVKPDVIFHLAAHANVRASFTTPHTVINNNIMGTSYLLEAIRLLGQDPLIQLCSTSEVYGQVDPKNVPITEDCPIRPASPYAVSKTAQDLLGWAYFRSYGQRVIRTRMFTYFNPRRTDLFATSFARQIAWIEQGLLKEVRHGNLESVRTFVDVRDAVRAYWDAVLYCEPGEAYNIGGDTVMTVGECLERLCRLARVPIKKRMDPQLKRPADVTLQIPNSDKFKRATGWKPRYGFDESLRFLLDHWRREARREALLREAAAR